jgi:ankyrin repeat protein
MPAQSLTAGLAIVVCALLSGNAWSDSLASFGLRTKDKNPCRLTDGRGFEAPTIVLMTGAYDKLSKDKVAVLKVIDTAINAGCDIDEPDELGFSPLNAAILYNEPALVEHFLQAGADPYRRIVSSRASIDGLDAFEFLQMLMNKAPSQDRAALRTVLDQYR